MMFNSDKKNNGENKNNNIKRKKFQGKNNFNNSFLFNPNLSKRSKIAINRFDINNPGNKKFTDQKQELKKEKIKNNLFNFKSISSKKKEARCIIYSHINSKPEFKVSNKKNTPKIHRKNILEYFGNFLSLILIFPFKIKELIDNKLEDLKKKEEDHKQLLENIKSQLSQLLTDYEILKKNEVREYIKIEEIVNKINNLKTHYNLLFNKKIVLDLNLKEQGMSGNKVYISKPIKDSMVIVDDINSHKFLTPSYLENIFERDLKLLKENSSLNKDSSNLLELMEKHIGKFDVTVRGSSKMSQAISLRRCIVKKIIDINPNLYKYYYKKVGLVTSDSRIVARKKPGYVKSRKIPQSSKR